jgi:Protein of unknown function (DUF1326)
MKRVLQMGSLFCLVLAVVGASSEHSLFPEHRYVTFDGEDWHLKGEGIVCCPCEVPCPCRTNNKASFGHCEAAMYLHIRDGHYGKVKFSNTRVVNVAGDCAMTYSHLASLYFDNSTTDEQQSAFLKLLASFVPGHSVDFPHVRTVLINVQVTGGHLYQVSIPGTLQMTVDRNWGLPQPPMPKFAAVDYFSNTLQYGQNLRYVMHDDGAQLNFDYSRRQANYRDVDLDGQQYLAKKMLIQYQDGSGWFNPEQQRLIRELNLPMPDLAEARRLLPASK